MSNAPWGILEITFKHSIYFSVHEYTAKQLFPKIFINSCSHFFFKYRHLTAYVRYKQNNENISENMSQIYVTFRKQRECKVPLYKHDDKELKLYIMWPFFLLFSEPI